MLVATETCTCTQAHVYIVLITRLLQLLYLDVTRADFWSKFDSITALAARDSEVVDVIYT
jgi:hypothetical protein